MPNDAYAMLVVKQFRYNSYQSPGGPSNKPSQYNLVELLNTYQNFMVSIKCSKFND